MQGDKKLFGRDSGMCIENEFFHVVEALHNVLNNENFDLMAVVTRNLWFRRNIHGGIFGYPTQIVRKASESIEDFKSANTRMYARRDENNIGAMHGTLLHVIL